MCGHWLFAGSRVALDDVAEVFGGQGGGEKPEPRRSGPGRIVVQVGAEAAIPFRLIRAQVARQFAPAPGHVEGQDLGCPMRDHLTDDTGSQIAHVNWLAGFAGHDCETQNSGTSAVGGGEPRDAGRARAPGLYCG